MALTELEVKYAAKRVKPYKLADGGGLHVLVQPSGSKLWRMKYRFGGKERLLSFGKDARSRRDEARALLAQGQDPGLKRDQHLKLSVTFEVMAREWHGRRAESLKPTHAERVLARRERDAFSPFGATPIRDLTAPVILKAVRAVERAARSTSAGLSCSRSVRCFAMRSRKGLPSMIPPLISPVRFSRGSGSGKWPDCPCNSFRSLYSRSKPTMAKKILGGVRSRERHSCSPC